MNGHDTGTPTPPLGDAGGPCPYLPTDTVDHDGDGWSGADGDCNDCNKFINPGAYDIPSDGIDEDCDGKIDDEPTGCDSSLTGPATSVGSDGAKAMDLCRTTADGVPLPKKTWGVISADYVLPDGSNSPVANPDDGDSTAYSCSFSASSFLLGFGVLGPTFGASNKTQQGARMLGLSTGTARQPTDSGYVASNDNGGPLTGGMGYPGFDKCYTSGAPAGFPGQTPACPSVTFGAAHDGAALRMVLRVPTNALTMSFDTNFFSYEFPSFVCSTYNDTFVVIMTPAPSGEPPTANDNIAFDSKGNIISVNAGFLSVCDTNTQAANGATYPCTEGPSKLVAHRLRHRHDGDCAERRRSGPRLDRLAHDDRQRGRAGGQGHHAALCHLGLVGRRARHDRPGGQRELDVRDVAGHEGPGRRGHAGHHPEVRRSPAQPVNGTESRTITRRSGPYALPT